MGFTVSDPKKEKRMIQEIISKNPEAEKWSKEFNEMYELKKSLVMARNAKHKTQKDVAMSSGLSQQAVSLLETGTGGATLLTLFRYLEAIGCKLKIEEK